MIDKKSELLAKLLDKKRQSLFVIAYRKLYSKSIEEREKEAEDIVQEVIFEVLKNKEKYFGLKNLYSEICKKVENKANYRNKRSQRYIYPENLDEFDKIISKAIEILEEENPHNLYEKKEYKEKILKYGDLLNEKYKDIFFLRILHNYKFNEISEILNLSESLVRKRYCRACYKLIKCIGKLYGTKNISS